MTTAPTGPAPSTRLFFIVAREAPIAVVFRRGPTRHVEVLTWDLESDVLSAGQWLKGRIYERRCDLSPTGEFLAVFAAKWETPTMTWTAISRPPWLTALAVWPKGDAWGGGGLFDDGRHFRLNHWPNQMTPTPEGHLPEALEVRALGAASGWGEDFPILQLRLERDGWSSVEEESQRVEHRDRDPIWITFDPPIRFRRPIGPRRAVLELELAKEGVSERQGAWWVQSYRLRQRGTVVRELGRADWADRGPHGDLLLARDGRLYRLRATALVDDIEAPLVEVADLRAHRFEPRVAPPSALRW